MRRAVSVDAVRLAREIVSSGGLTANVESGRVPTDGWAVSLAGAEWRLPLAAFGAGDVARYLAAFGPDLSGPDRFLGAWVDGADVYLDVSVVVADRSRAVELGVLNGQLAVFCLASGEAVSLVGVSPAA